MLTAVCHQPVAIQSNQIKHDAIKGMPKGQMPKRFIEPDGMHLVKISPYGRGNIMTETRELKDAQFLQASTNPEFVRNLERAIQEAEEKHTEAGQLEQEVGSKIQQAKSESRDIRKTLVRFLHCVWDVPLIPPAGRDQEAERGHVRGLLKIQQGAVQPP